MMGKIVWKTYWNITNTILRISDGTAAGKANAVLVNAHIDRCVLKPVSARGPNYPLQYTPHAWCSR